MTPDAGTAARLGDGATCVHKNLDQAVFQSLLVNAVAGRGDDHAGVGVDLLLLQDTSSDFQVGVAGVGAGADWFGI